MMPHVDSKATSTLSHVNKLLPPTSELDMPWASRKEDYRGWIAYHKRKWRTKTEQRKKAKVAASKRRKVDDEPQRPAGRLRV